MTERHAGIIDHAILFGIDGLRPDCITEADCPNLSALLRRATILARHRSVFPTVTRVNLASLMTGACPRDHGIVGNAFFLRDAPRTTPFDTADLDDLEALDGLGQCRALRERHTRRSLHDHGGQLAVLATGSVGSFNVLSGFQDDTDLVYNPRLHRDVSTATTGNSHASRWPARVTDRFICHVWPRCRPMLTVLWFAEADSAGHDHGVHSPEHRSALKEIDAELGRLVDWRDAQPDAARIGIGVVSDHGQVTVGRSISIVDWLCGQGFRAGPRLDQQYDIAVIPGMAPSLWLPSFDPGLLRDVTDCLTEQDWCGPAFAARNGGDPIPGTFPLDTVALDHALSPDLVMSFRGNGAVNGFGLPGIAAGDLAGSPLAIGAGHHGGIHQTELSCLFALEGAAFAAATRTDLASCTAHVIPTICAALGLDTTFSAAALPLARDLDNQNSVQDAALTATVRAGRMRHDLYLQASGRVVHVEEVKTGHADTN